MLEYRLVGGLVYLFVALTLSYACDLEVSDHSSLTVVESLEKIILLIKTCILLLSGFFSILNALVLPEKTFLYYLFLCLLIFYFKLV